MAGGVIVIGSRVLNMPFALAGAGVRTAAPGTAMDAFRAAQADGADLVLLSPACAAELPNSVLEVARRTGRPLVLVLPGPGAEQFDVQARVRRALGLEA
ncbi:MAG: hypothetical protein NTZ79_14315 [Proteobacteria bacterium]|nr:hypothetical protein [Pseudomonadota bacterium]